MTDDELLDALRVAAADPVPEGVLVAARAAFGLRALDAELAELVADSLLTAGAVRGGGGVRLLSFETRTVTVELQVTTEGPVRRLLGELSGARGPVRLDSPTSTSGVDLDVAGRFVADVPPGLLRLRCTGEDGTPVVTSWTEL